jgi:translation initiation factor 5
MASVQENINIGSKNLDDPYYRYKMPALIIKNKGKGNGVKTELVNISDISKSLARDSESIMKFIGYELGTLANGIIINGKFDENILKKLIEKYIEKFVICDVCGNPETFFVVRKKLLKKECKACGERYDVDIKHKLTDYIIRHLK